jgi:hypothetical protein
MSLQNDTIICSETLVNIFYENGIFSFEAKSWQRFTNKVSDEILSNIKRNLIY